MSMKNPKVLYIYVCSQLDLAGPGEAVVKQCSPRLIYFNHGRHYIGARLG